MRDIEYILIGGNIAGSVIFGCQGQPVWLLVPVLAFLTYAVSEFRSLSRQIGDRAWPSAGYARFTLGSDLYLLVWNSALATLLFGIGGLAARIAGA